MKYTKKALALFLALCMMVTSLPLSANATEMSSDAETLATGLETESNAVDSIATDDTPTTYATDSTNAEYLFFATDRHTNTSIIGNIINNMESVIGENELDYLGLGGDMVGSGNSHPAYNSSTVLSEVTGATSSLSATNVDIVAGIHDMNVTDDAGIVLPYSSGGAQIYEGDRFYVYGVPESCISGAVSGVDPETEADNFVTWANGSNIDKSKVIIVLSHYPLHQRRNDNVGAVYWADALNTVAAGDDTTIDRDVAFFWGHNYTGESSTDTAVYHVAPGNNISVQGGSSSQTIYFTYANAGYLNASSSATLMAITDTTITLEKYSTSGTGEDITSFARVAKAATVTGISVTTAPTKTTYAVGEEFDKTGMVVTATYSDGTSAEITDYVISDVDMSTAGTKTVTVTYEEQTASFEITVNEVEKTVEASDNAVVISATSLGLKNIAIENVTGTPDLSGSFSDYISYDITLTGYTEGNDVTYVMSLPEGMTTTNLKLYALNADGTLGDALSYTAVTDASEFATITFTTIGDGKFVAGVPVIEIPEGAELTKLEVVTPPSTTKYFVEAEQRENELYLNITGLVVKATYSNGTDTVEKELDWNDFDTSADAYALAFDMTTIGKQNVEVSYTYGEITKTATFEITICYKTETTTDTNVSVTFKTPEVTAVEITENTDDVKAVVETLLKDFVSYNFKFEGYTEGNTVTVTLPIPEGVTNPGVYHVSDAGVATRVSNVTENNDGTVTFEAKAFSSYVIGENTEIIVPDPTTATVEDTVTTTSKKTVYVLTSNIESGNSYLIANSNVAGSANLVANDDGDLSNTTATVVHGDCDGDGDSEYYIELTDATNGLWTVSNGYRFQNQDEYLRCSNGRLSVSSSSTAWSYSNNRLSCVSSSGGMGGPGGSSNTTYYLRYYNNGWTVTNQSSSASNIYFYEPNEVDVPTSVTVKGTYSIAGKAVSLVVTEGTTTTLESTLTFTPESGTATTTNTSTTATYTVVDDGDPFGIISGISGNTLTFTGNYGKALVKVSYSATTEGGTSYTVDNYIVVEAKEPTYTIDITDGSKPIYDTDGTTVTGYQSVTDTLVIKGVETGDTYELNDVIYYEDESGKSEVADEEIDTTKLTWESLNPEIASVDTDGTVTFTGAEGTVQITVLYEYADGKSVTDIVTFSVSKSQYVLPSDGTNDFPEYPNQGAIRFDKTATAVGSFSETGIAQVELSMTGVPYTTGNEMDVVVMLDMSTSMDDDRIAATVAATKVFIDSVVKNEDGTYNDNRVYVGYFNGDKVYTITDADNIGGELASVDNDAEYNALISAIEAEYDGALTASGTNYDVSLEECYNVLTAAKTDGTGNERKQFCVFMSDGGPTDYATSATNVISESSVVDYFSVTASDSANWTNTMPEEYWSGLMKENEVTIYSVGLILNEQPTSGPSAYRNYSAAQNYYVTSTILTGISSGEDYFYHAESATDTSDMEDVFSAIAQKILEAATNVVVEDKIADEYTMNFSLPSGVTADEAGMDDFYIQVLGYELDENNERKDNPEILERFLFNSDGTITHTIGTVTCGDTCTHVTYTNDTVTAIDGTYFDYSSTKDGEILTWTADKLDRTELALQYFVYLDNSAGDVAAADQVEAGTYNTNEYATITYTNFLGNECQQEFPVPSLTWNGAQVTYVFYLVNENGQPVNRAGKVIPFAEAIYVTDPVTYDVTWNDDKGIEKLEAAYLASEKVPDVYSLYDENAYYEILVYQTEGVDSETDAKNYNHFIIEGSTSGITNLNTTKVFNTKAGVRYDSYGAYSSTAGTYTSSKTGTSYTAKVTSDIDYANTTVAFAVVWKPALVEDTVVVDYGLPVVIDVVANDTLASGVVGVRDIAPSNVEINTGTYKSEGGKSIELDYGTATVENLTSVRYTPNVMTFDEPEVFYYESDVNYYEGSTLVTTSMYSSVTVVPATNIYYEDTATFVSYLDGSFDSTGTNGKWTVDGTQNASATQDVDRPGESKISEALDKDNIYGYDSAYLTSSTYSLGSAHKVTVSAMTNTEGTWPTATFTFTGTAFDIISLTSKDTGTITVNVVNADGSYNKNWFVDTYYGYTFTQDKENPYVKYTFSYGTDGKWHMVAKEDVNYNTPQDGETAVVPTSPKVGDTFVTFEKNGVWKVTEDTANSLYQIPVIKSPELTYDTYTVTVMPRYANAFNHVGDTAYDFYLDAIRVYNPADDGLITKEDGTVDTTINDAYKADGEAYPEYIEIRTSLLEQTAFDTTEASVTGAVFIDGFGTSGTISDYSEYGPNNEVYLQKGQAVAFKLSNSAYATVDAVHLGVKAPTGGDASVTVTELDGNSQTITTSSATEQYFDISDCTTWTGSKTKVLLISNPSDAMVSLTNLKITYTGQAEATSLMMSSEDAAEAVSFMSLRYLASVPVKEVFVPETMEVNVNKTSVRANEYVTVTVTTSADVEKVTVNGEEVSTNRVDQSTGLTTWTYYVKAVEKGELALEVIAYNSDGLATESVVNTVEVTASAEEQLKDFLSELLGWLLG